MKYSLDNNVVSNKLEKGKIYGMVSDNGKGKSMILKYLLRIYRISNVIIIGNNLKVSFSDSLRSVSGYVDFISFYEYLTAYENLRYFALLYEIPIDKIDGILNLVGLCKDKIQVKKFSFDMKQRLGLAIALLKSPNVILLDETINDLDVKGVFELRNLLLSLENQIVIISSTDVSNVEKIVDDVLFIDNKKLVLKSLSRFGDESSYKVICDNCEDCSKLDNKVMVCEDEEKFSYNADVNQDGKSLEDMLVSMIEED